MHKLKMCIVTLKERERCSCKSVCAVVIYTEGRQSLTKPARAAHSSPRLLFQSEDIYSYAGTKGEIRLYNTFFILSQ